VRYGILSDVHGNLPALQRVLKTCAEIKLDYIVFLGDAVGYGASPNQCISLIRKEASSFIGGNHDFGAVGTTLLDNFNLYAREALVWTGRTLTMENQHYLKGRALTEERDGCLLVHASPYEPQKWHYIFKVQEASLCFSIFHQHVCFIGHSHLPGIFILKPDASISFQRRESIILENDSRYIINVGSVGQPRDGDPRASFGVLDTENAEYSLRRVAYDIREAQTRILSMGLPRFLAERLALGK
jgi:predicted phosphodiesterase